MGRFFSQRNASTPQRSSVNSITLGTVMDTNDPQQLGRLKIMCPSLGDDNTQDSTDHLPWATYCSPTGGMVNSPGFTRGPNDGSTSKGPMAYGMWSIPRRGSTVMVACIDGDPYYRVWMGAIFDQGTSNTMPHGRFMYQSANLSSGQGTPEGPLNGFEEPIEPAYTNFHKAFGAKSANYEWRTRGADYSAGGNTTDFANISPSAHVDETTKTPFTSADGKSFDVQNGYAANRTPGESANESSVFSWTTPGFHGFSMDDRAENCRIKIRTSSGTQLILDDTNERIYLHTAEGANWFEMDFDGNIDVYSKTKINLHAESDVNIASDKSVRIYGKTGIYLNSGGDIIESATGKHGIKAGGDVIQEAGGAHSAKAGSDLTHEAGGSSNFKAGGDIIFDGSAVTMEGQPAASAQSGIDSFVPSRIPQHEPWARTSTQSDTSMAPKYTYDDPNVGSEDKTRGKYWRR